MIQIENTPNPESLKFVTEQVISTSGRKNFKKIISKIYLMFL